VDTLNFSKIQHGKFRIECSVASILSGVSRFFKPFATSPFLATRQNRNSANVKELKRFQAAKSMDEMFEIFVTGPKFSQVGLDAAVSAPYSSRHFAN
jgi:hypothetical protein